MSSALVIGAGIGGLTAAMKLAHQGWSVEVVEKQGEPGGRCGRVEQGGFRWDLGPTILLMPFVFRRTFESVGRRLEDYLLLTRVDPSYHITFRDGSTLTMTSELTRMREELERFEPGSFQRYLAFLAKGQVRHDVALDRFVGQHFGSLAEFLTPRNIPDILRVGAHQRLYGQVAAVFKDERLRQAMSFQTMYLGVSPFEAPAVFSLLPYTEAAHGIWYPRGGMGQIGRAVERVCRELGVTLTYSSAVQRILVEGGRAVGVRLADGSERRADVVVCNADYPWARKHLFDERYPPSASLETKRYTSSAYVLYWGLKRRYDGFAHHNIYFGRDFAGSFEAIFEKKTLPEDLSFYVNAPAHLDPTMAPAGKDAIQIMVPVPHRTAGIRWAEEGPRVRARILARLAELGFGGIEADVEVERIITPDDWEAQLNLERGSNYGLAQSMFQIGPFRPAVYDREIANLYYCGASAQPGTGVPTVMISAELAVQAITRKTAAAPAPAGVRPRVQEAV